MFIISLFKKWLFFFTYQSPNLKSHPLLALTHPSQCVLKAGELLYVPSGSPHFVENLTTSLAVSSNHVDSSNYKKVNKLSKVSSLGRSKIKMCFSSHFFKNSNEAFELGKVNSGWLGVGINDTCTFYSLYF